MAVTTQQARKRFSSLPVVLQDAIFSAQNAEIISLILEKNNVPEDKSGGVSKAAGMALLGFIHPEDLSQEIQNETGLAPQLAKTISDEISVKIFNLLKDELDKVYAPVPHEEEATPIPIAPKIIEEVKKPPAAGTKAAEEIKLSEINLGPLPPFPEKAAGMPLPLQPPAKIPGAISGAEPGLMETPKAPTEISPAASGAEPLVKFGGFRSATLVGERAATPPPPSLSFTTERGGQAGPMKTEAPAGEKAKPGAPEPAPAILHEETAAQLSKSASGFRLDLPVPKLSQAKPEKEPLKPAVLELGMAAAAPPAQKAAASEPPAFSGKAGGEPPKPLRVVHYSEFRTSLETAEGGAAATAPKPPAMGKVEPPAAPIPFGAAQSGALARQAGMEGREIKEITASPPPFRESRRQAPASFPAASETSKPLPAPPASPGEMKNQAPPVPPVPPRPRIEPPPPPLSKNEK